MIDEISAIREKNFEERKRHMPILRANRRYNGYLSQIDDMVKEVADKKSKLLEYLRQLEIEADGIETRLAQTPNIQELIMGYREKLSLRDLICQITLNTHQEGDIQTTIDNMKLSPLTSARQIRNYDAILEDYTKRGIVIHATKSNLLEKIGQLNDYQIIVCGRDLVIPSPLSMPLFKNPTLTEAEAIEKLVQYAADHRLRKKHGKDGKGTVIDVNYAKTYGDATLRIEAEKLLKDKSLIRIAQNAVSDLPQFDSLDILTDRVLRHIIGDGTNLEKYRAETPLGYSRELFNDYDITPDAALRAAVDLIHPQQEYIALHFFGFEPETPLKRMMTITQNEIGMQMYLYVKLVRENICPEIPFNDIIRPTKIYANGVEGPVLSRSRKHRNHQIQASYVPIFPKGADVDMSRWPDIDMSCPCEHAIFISTLHGRQQRYLDAHTIALNLDSDYAALLREDNILNPIFLPTESMHEFNRIVDEQTLMRNKINRSVRVPNRAEQSWLSMMYLKANGYDACLTTDLNRDFGYILRR